jgi:hypothetical protein
MPQGQDVAPLLLWSCGHQSEGANVGASAAADKGTVYPCVLQQGTPAACCGVLLPGLWFATMLLLLLPSLLLLLLHCCWCVLGCMCTAALLLTGAA